MSEELTVDCQFPLVGAEDIVDFSYREAIVRRHRPNPAVYLALIQRRHFYTICGICDHIYQLSVSYLSVSYH